MSGLVKFGSITAIPENADAFQGQAFSPNGGDSMNVSVCPDVSLALDPNSGSYMIMGGNKSAAEADMFPVKDESGNSGAIALNTPFIKNFFPYKYIGFKYIHGANAAAGTVSFYYEQRVTRTNLI